MDSESLVELPCAEVESFQVAVPSMASRCHGWRAGSTELPSTSCCQEEVPSAGGRGAGCCQLGVDCCSHGFAGSVNCCHAGRDSSEGEADAAEAEPGVDAEDGSE